MGPIELKVEYKQLNSFFADYAKNISRGTTSINSDKSLPLGTRFLFKMFIPESDYPFTLEGEVVGATLERGEPGMKIRFLYESREQRAEFERWVEQKMADSLGERLAEKVMGRPLCYKRSRR